MTKHRRQPKPTHCDLCGREEGGVFFRKLTVIRRGCIHCVCDECQFVFGWDGCAKCIADAMPEIDRQSILVERRLPRVQQYLFAAERGLAVKLEQLADPSCCSCSDDRQIIEEHIATRLAEIEFCQSEIAALLALAERVEQEKSRKGQGEQERAARAEAATRALGDGVNEYL